MPVLQIIDRAHEFRMIVVGRLAEDFASELEQKWAAALTEALPRRLTMDISHLSGYDLAGRRLLRKMYEHGTEFAASTASSLVHLADITAPKSRVAVVLGTIDKKRPSRAAGPSGLALRAASG